MLGAGIASLVLNIISNTRTVYLVLRALIKGTVIVGASLRLGLLLEFSVLAVNIWLEWTKIVLSVEAKKI